MGLGGVNALGIAEPQAEDCATRWTSLPTSAEASDKATVPVGRRVVVIGGGMTAVDAAVQARLLGAEKSP